MRIWYAALVVLCCILAVGCRTNSRVAALQRDNRLKEDEIYRLRWQVEDYEEELQRRRQTPQAGDGSAYGPPAGQTLLQRLGAPAVSEETTPSNLSVQVGESISPDEFLQSRDVEEPSSGPVLPFPEPADDDDAPAPAWTQPDDMEPAEEAPRWSPPPSGQQPQRTQRSAPPSQDAPAEADSAVVLPQEESHRVAQMRIATDATGGHNLDGQVGDDGLQVAFELFDDRGRPLRIPAEVSIVLLDPDPTLQGNEARVARWDFTAEEVNAAIRTSEGTTRGIPLKVVWREKAPQNEVLHLFVRYNTADGRRLEDQIEVRIRLTGSPASAGWKMAPDRSPPPPPEEDRATSNPEPPAEHTRFAGRPEPPSRQQEPATRAPEREARLTRPQWSPNRP